MSASPRTSVSIFLIAGLVALAFAAGCSKQEPAPQATQSAAQQPAPAPQQAAPAAQPPEPSAPPRARTTKPRPVERAASPATAPAPNPAAQPPAAPAQAAAAPPQHAAPVPVRRTIPADTLIEVRLQEPLSSANAAAGQQFAAVLASPIVVDGVTIAATGANAWGTVVKATPSGRLQTPAELAVRLDALEIRGRRVPVSTETVGQKGDSHQKRNAVGIGGGAALGAIIGGIAGGGKGAAIGAAAGAGAGTAGAAVTGKKDITYAVEAPLTFRLTNALVVD